MAAKKSTTAPVRADHPKKARKARVPAAADAPTESAAAVSVLEPKATPTASAEGPVPTAVGRPVKGKRAPAARRLGALDAAAKVLGEAGRPMSCPELIAEMAAKGYWTSPNGKTPHATLYAACLREQKTKGDSARFVKTGRGLFALRGTV